MTDDQYTEIDREECTKAVLQNADVSVIEERVLCPTLNQLTITAYDFNVIVSNTYPIGLSSHCVR